MRLLAAENVPLPSIEALRAGGHDVASVLEQAAGARDQIVLSIAQEEQRVLVTFDRDFGELIFRPNVAASIPPAVLFLRFTPRHPTEAADVLGAVFLQPGVSLDGMFTVVDRDRVRQRRLPASEPKRE